MRHEAGVHLRHGGGHAATLVALAALLCFSPACKKKQRPPEAAERPAPGTQPRATVSAVTVISDDKAPQMPVAVRNPAAEFDIWPSGYFQSYQVRSLRPYTLEDPEIGNAYSDLLTADGKEVRDFVVDMASVKIQNAKSEIGAAGKQIEVTSRSKSRQIEKTLKVEVYDDFPLTAFCAWSYRNLSAVPVHLDRVVVQRHRLDATIANSRAARYDFWSFHGASVEPGARQVFPLGAGFSQRNVMGLPVAVKGDLAAVGGGIPMVAAWTETMGMAVGLAEPYPVAVSLPVRVPPDERVELSAEFEPDVRLQHEQTFTTPRTFVSVYEGDYADALANYAGILARQGLPPAKPADSDYGAFWSSLGYGRDVTPAQMTGTIPKLKELGIGWAALDDRWARTYGDWEPRGDTFPGDSLRKVVQEFHRNAIKVLLAWFPLGVEDGEGREASRKYEVAQVVRDHPDWLILDKSGKHAHGTRGLAVLCPALPEVQEYYRALTTRFLRDWDFDGNRLEDVYSVPRCYNPRHHHKSPDDSIRAMGEVFKAIHSTARAIRPDSVTQIDPDGTLPNMAWLAYLDQGAAGDPANLQQARRRLQTYKALLGPRAAVSSGFAELLENAGGGSETAAASAYFASTLGTGGVLSTAFTWPESASRSGKFFLSPEKEVLWKKWFGLYAQRKLSSGGFLDLYRYGFDSPEGYVLRQDGKLYYAFFAPEPDKPWKGNIELRGLARRVQYRVFDYENQKELGTVESPVFTMPVEFTGHLLLEVSAKQ